MYHSTSVVFSTLAKFSLLTSQLKYIQTYCLWRLINMVVPGSVAEFEDKIDETTTCMMPDTRGTSKHFPKGASRCTHYVTDTVNHTAYRLPDDRSSYNLSVRQMLWTPVSMQAGCCPAVTNSWYLDTCQLPPLLVYRRNPW